MLYKIIDKIHCRLKLLKPVDPVPDMTQKRRVISSYQSQFKPAYFIETGTFLGDTTAFFKNDFKNIISIELSDELAAKAKRRFESDDNIRIIQGDSGSILPEILKEISEPVLFWLDGHYSSEFFVNDELIKTARGEYDTPIEKEIDCIIKSKVYPIILIDDARLFDGKNDYPSLSSLENRLKKSVYKFKFIVDTDIIQIIPCRC